MAVDVRITILPKTRLGKWSVGLAVASVAFFAFSEVLTNSVPIGLVFKLRLTIALTVVLAGMVGAAFATGLVSVLKRKERSVLVFLAIAVGLYGLIGTIGSLLGLAR